MAQVSDIAAATRLDAATFGFGMSVLGYQFPGQQGFDVAVLTINAWSLKLVRRQPAVVSGGGLILLANLLLQIRSRKAIPPVAEVRTTPAGIQKPSS